MTSKLSRVEREVARWNRLYPPGTPVRYWPAGETIGVNEGRLGVTASAASRDASSRDRAWAREDVSITDAAVYVTPSRSKSRVLLPLDRVVVRSEARRGANGDIVPGVWAHPAIGPSRFKLRADAIEYAWWVSTSYGPGCFEATVIEEPSQSRPGEVAFQVYIRSLGALEGLIRYTRDTARPEHEVIFKPRGDKR